MALQANPSPATVPATMDGSRILVVDDDAGIRALLSDFLEQHGFAVTAVGNGAAMDRAMAADGFDIAVLDVMMPGEDGLSILRRLTARGGPPVIMLSAIGSDVDRIVGLEMGAEDYLPKPCNPRELLARIRTVLRRHRRVAEAREPQGEKLRFAGWQADMTTRLLTDPDNVVVTLTDGEFRLLRAFIEHPRRVLSRDQLLDYSAGNDSESYDRAIDVQVSRLRRKLERGAKAGGPRNDGADELVRTIRNEGYMFTAEVRPV
ncbi:response regulator [Sphingobium sp.]|uniref:response regulator n=1 Tax=Sphingobium sp. TaxID=1912891 RepID=UPI0035C70D6A